MTSDVLRFVFMVLLVVPVLLVGARPAGAQSGVLPVSSTFDTDTEGWTTVFVNRQRNPPLAVHAATGGNPGGYVYGADQSEGPQWYWVAPPKFYGDRSAAYGYLVSFDQRTTDISNPITTLPSIILLGGGISIAFPTSVLPSPEWTRIKVRLDETAGWVIRNADGTLGGAATAADIRTVLGSLTSLQIRAEYNFGPDTNSLDTVVLGEVPAEQIFLPIVQQS